MRLHPVFRVRSTAKGELAAAAGDGRREEADRTGLLTTPWLAAPRSGRSGR